MEVSDAILSRRSIKKFRPDPVPADVLDRALAAGLWAQNHHLTQPWRFIVLGPQTHRALAAANADVQLEALGSDGDAEARGKLRALAEGKFMSKPRIVVVTYHLNPDAQERREDFAATCCAVQNIQLAAWDIGLGMQWSSNVMTRHPRTYALLGIDPTAEEIVGFLYFGFPAEVPQARPRKGLDEVRRNLP
ncbi:MAG: nitroreductase [Chloroflexi bacterium]|nr:nitroreductase [Chloroflexota bacterium]MCL5275163.1 nitroreductase [Chloroflexota bacterium]